MDIKKQNVAADVLVRHAERRSADLCVGRTLLSANKIWLPYPQPALSEVEGRFSKGGIERHKEYKCRS